MEADETSRQVKKNMTQFGHYFVPELQRHDANTVASRGRILKYNGHWLQVFCASKRRIILSRDYFLAKDEPLNRDVLCADINYNFLIVSLRRPTTGVISTKFISLNNNQDLGEIVEDSTFTKVIEVDDLPKTTAVDVRLVVINNRNQVIMIVGS